MKKILISLMMILSLVSKSQTTKYVNVSLNTTGGAQFNSTIVNDTLFCDIGDTIVFSTTTSYSYLVGVSVHLPSNIDTTSVYSITSDSVRYIIGGYETWFGFEHPNSNIPFINISGTISVRQVIVNTQEYNSPKVSFTIYPNYISIVGSELSSTKIYSIDGKLITSNILRSGNVEIENLSHGIYILDIDEQIKYKFIK